LINAASQELVFERIQTDYLLDDEIELSSSATNIFYEVIVSTVIADFCW